MPRVTLGMTDEQKLKRNCNDIRDCIEGLRKSNGITQQRLSEYTGLSRQRISYQLKHGLSMELFIAVIQLGDLDDLDQERLRRLMLKR